LDVPKGTTLHIPIYAIHHDPQYYPNPNQFDPERFMPENKDRLVPYTYLPFGTGPRNCVGLRFALMNVKTAVANIIEKFKFVKTHNTKTEFQYKKFVIFTQAIDMGTIKAELR
jgi:cytochrome P450